MARTTFSGPVKSDAGFEGDVVLATAITTLTDNTGGTSGGNTVANITGVDGTGSNAASLADTENAIATLTAKINEILAALGQ